MILCLSKMGCDNITVFDVDGVTEHNLPNQFYGVHDVGEFKVEALSSWVAELNGYCRSFGAPQMYEDQPLEEIVIVGTDSMSSRMIVWKQFLKQKQAKYLIEARMGAEVGQVYTIQKKDRKFYEERLYPDSKVKVQPCSARSIMYNVLMVSSLVCRAFKAVVHEEKFPRELTFNMKRIDELSWLVRV